MIEGIVCGSVKQLSNEIYELLKTKHKKYTLRPFNRFNAEKSMWWIIPSTEFPAYKFGKFMIDENPNGTYSLGIHIEKGFQKSIDSKEKEMLEEGWIWHEFMSAIEQGEIDKILKEIDKKYGYSLEILISIDIPEMNTGALITLSDSEFIDKQTGNKVSVEQLPKKIKNIDGIEWFWVDLFVYFGIKKVTNETEAKWTTNSIVEDLLVPFEKWIK